MTTSYTANLRFPIPDFLTSPWHATLEQSIRAIDNTIYLALLTNGLSLWQNSHVYAIGNLVISPVDGTFWVASQAHTSSASPTTFTAEVTAFPLRWRKTVSVPANRGAWVTGTTYLENDFVVDTNRFAVCTVAHVAGATFDADAAAGKWTILIDLSGNIPTAINNLTEGSLVANATVDLASVASSFINITGVSTITSFGTGVNLTKVLRFSGASILTHNSTTLIIPTGQSFVLADGDCMIVRSNASGNWRVISLTRASGSPLDLDARLMATGAGMYGGIITESHSAGAQTYFVKTLSGVDPSPSDPVWFVIPSPGGIYTKIKAVAPLSVTIPSGATLGVPAGAVPFRNRLFVFNNSGTLVLGVRQCVNAPTSGTGNIDIMPPPMWFMSSTLISAAAGSAGVTYSNPAVTGATYIEIGSADYGTGVSAAGTWDATPQLILVGSHYKYCGDEVYKGIVQSTGITTVTQSTYQNTHLSKAVSLINACNLFEISFTGALYSVTSANSVYARIHRDAVAVGGEAQGFTAAGGESIWPGCISPFLDKPGNTSAHTYMLKLKNTNNVNNVALGFSATAQTIMIREVAG